MSITLSLSPKLAPFPYAAVAIAACTGITVSYDDALTGLSIASGQSDITTEDDIVKHLAELGGLSSDSTDVGLHALLPFSFSYLRPSFLLLPLRCATSLCSVKSLQYLTRSMIVSHYVLSSSDRSPLLQTGLYGVP
jgi:hypothetical protein